MDKLPDGYIPTNRKYIEEPKPRITKRYASYRPLGFLITISFLVFLQLGDMGVPLPFAVLVTILVALLTLMFS